MKLITATAAAMLIASSLYGQSADRSDPVLEDCQLSLLPENFIEISADKSGKLENMSVREGSIVDEGAVIAQVDDLEATMQLKVAGQKEQAALARARDMVEEKYAAAAADVAENDLRDLQAANAGGLNTVSKTEMRAKELEWTRAKLQIEKARKDRTLAAFDWQVANVEKEAAQTEVDRRVVTAPFSGQVVELFRKQGEWVEAGEPILQFARYDTLECDGNIDLMKYDPREIEGCKVTIEATVGGGRKETAEGRITYVEQQVLYDGRFTYRVLAQIPNHVDRGRWALFPGLRATMTIHMGTAGDSVGSRIEGRNTRTAQSPQ